MGWCLGLCLGFLNTSKVGLSQKAHAWSHSSKMEGSSSSALWKPFSMLSVHLWLWSACMPIMFLRILKKHSTSLVVLACGCSGGKFIALFLLLTHSLLSIVVVSARSVSLVTFIVILWSRSGMWALWGLLQTSLVSAALGLQHEYIDVAILYIGRDTLQLVVEVVDKCK